MKKNVLLLILILQVINLQAIEVNADLFTFDEEKVSAEFEELDKLEAILLDNPTISAEDLYAEYYQLYNSVGSNILDVTDLLAVDSMNGMSSYFWTAFAVGAIGTFFIYGAVAGPIAVAVIYFTTDKNVESTKEAAWGCAAGTLLGAGVKWLVSAL